MTCGWHDGMLHGTGVFLGHLAKGPRRLALGRMTLCGFSCFPSFFGERAIMYTIHWVMGEHSSHQVQVDSGFEGVELCRRAALFL